MAKHDLLRTSLVAGTLLVGAGAYSGLRADGACSACNYSGLQFANGFCVGQQAGTPAYDCNVCEDDLGYWEYQFFCADGTYEVVGVC